MNKNKVSSELINPVSRQESKLYPYKRIDMHSIQATKFIVDEHNAYRVIGNRGNKVADFFTTYAVFNREFKEVTDKQTIHEVHELTLYLSLDFYIEGLQNAFSANVDDDGRLIGSATDSVTHPLSEQDMINLAALWETYKAIRALSDIPIEEAKRSAVSF